jgi:hypothetical protein
MKPSTSPPNTPRSSPICSSSFNKPSDLSHATTAKIMSRLALLCALLSLGLASTSLAKEPFKPNLGPDLPTITVTCGEVSLLLRQGTQWTPGRIDFRGSAMTTERSAYGTVFSFPNVGFIGTAHLENEPEQLQSLAFYLDDQPIPEPSAQLTGTAFRFDRQSRIRDFQLHNRVELRENQLIETTTVKTEKAVPLTLVYHFMHAWQPTVSAFLAGKDAAPDARLSGSLNDDPATARQFHINERVDWIAVYEPNSQQFAVSRLFAAPALGGHVSMIWNVPGSYRKYYLKCFPNESVPAGFEGTWKMVTAFGSSSLADWQTAATTLAQQLSKPARESE